MSRGCQVQKNIVRRTRPAPRFNARDPAAIAICDGCGFLVQHNTLREKMEYRGGMTPVGTGLMVCPRCDDVPNPYGQLQVLPPDPVPVRNPRPDVYPTWYLLTEDGDTITTTEDDVLAVNGDADVSLADLEDTTWR